MPASVDSFDLSSLHLDPGEGRRLELAVTIDPLELGGEPYGVNSLPVAVRLDISRTTGGGYALRLRLDVTIEGPCMCCLEPAAPAVAVDAREYSLPNESEELDSPYLQLGVLELGAWARDALVLALPTVLLCRAGCAGLCPQCGVDLNTAGPDHGHPSEPDPRWAKLSELRLD